MAKVEVEIDYFEGIINNDEDIKNTEHNNQKRNHYLEIIRQLKKHKINTIEVDESDLNNYKNEYELTNAVKNHKNELSDVINKEIVGDDNGKSYINVNDLKGILDSHFEKVESLLERYQEQRLSGKTFSKSFNDLKNNLVNLINDFKEKIIENINEAKEKITNKIESTKDNVNENINDVKKEARNKINFAVTSINGRIKSISQTLDEFVGNDTNMMIEKDNNQKNELKKSYRQESVEDTYDSEERITKPSGLKIKTNESEMKSEENNKENKENYEKVLNENKKLKQSNNTLKNKLQTIETFFKQDESAFKKFDGFLKKENHLENKKEKKINKEKGIAL